MARLTKEQWLSGSDLEEQEIEVPELDGTVKIRSLPAAYSNQANSEALEYRTVGDNQIATVNTAKLEVLQFQYGVIEPTFTRAEVERLAERYGRAFRRVITAIDEMSGVDKAAIEKAEARFQGGRAEPNGTPVEPAATTRGR